MDSIMLSVAWFLLCLTQGLLHTVYTRKEVRVVLTVAIRLFSFLFILYLYVIDTLNTHRKHVVPFIMYFAKNIPNEKGQVIYKLVYVIGQEAYCRLDYNIVLCINGRVL